MAHPIDFLIVGIFFAVTFLIGVIDRKKVTIDDYWVNSRKTNKWVLVATMLSTFIGVGAILGNAGIAFSGGGFATFVIAGSFFFYFLIFARYFAPKIKEFGDKYNAYTIPDFFEIRYSPKVRLAGSLVNLVSFSLYVALQMLGFGVFVSALTGLNPILATIIGGLIVILYTSIGGLRADIRTDVFQSFIMLFLLLMFLPIVIFKAGGFGALLTLPKSFLVGTEFISPLVAIFAFFLLGMGILSTSDTWQRAYAADTKKNVRWAMKVSGILVFLFLAMAVLFGMYGKFFVPGATSNMVVAELLKKFLSPGIFGLVLAGFFAAIMSSADTMLLITSMTIVHDLYIKTLKKENMPAEKILRISRWTTFVVGLIALTLSLIIFNIVHITIEAISFYIVLSPAIIFGFYWKKANSIAALWSIILGFLTTVAFIFISPVEAFIPGLIVSFLSFLIINVLTKKKQEVLLQQI